MNRQAAPRALAPSTRRLSRSDYELYLPMVRRIAIRMARRVPSHITVDDLLGCGWVGLLEAFSRSSDRMTQEEIEAYASHRVKGAMLDYLRALDPTARQMRNTSRRIARAIARLSETLGRAPDELEIAGAMGLDLEDFRDALASIAKAGMARLEMLDIDQLDAPDQSVLPPDEGAGRHMLHVAVADAITALSPRLQQVLALYYQEDCTLREIGAVLGVTESRVSQLHSEAMHRLRASVGRE